MNWCCVSLIVAVPIFITKSAAVAGRAARPHANAASTVVENSARHGALRLLIIASPSLRLELSRARPERMPECRRRRRRSPAPDPMWAPLSAQAPSGGVACGFDRRHRDIRADTVIQLSRSRPVAGGRVARKGVSMIKTSLSVALAAIVLGLLP